MGHTVGLLRFNFQSFKAVINISGTSFLNVPLLAGLEAVPACTPLGNKIDSSGEKTPSVVATRALPQSVLPADAQPDAVIHPASFPRHAVLALGIMKIEVLFVNFENTFLVKRD